MRIPWPFNMFVPDTRTDDEKKEDEKEKYVLIGKIIIGVVALIIIIALMFRLWRWMAGGAQKIMVQAAPIVAQAAPLAALA